MKRIAILVAAVGISVLGLTAPATASSPTPASGTILLGPGYDPEGTERGANVVIRLTASMSIAGTLGTAPNFVPSVIFFTDSTIFFTDGAELITWHNGDLGLPIDAPGCPDGARFDLTITAVFDTSSHAFRSGVLRADATDSSDVTVRAQLSYDSTTHGFTYAGWIRCP